jgi:hypothetical protein
VQRAFATDSDVYGQVMQERINVRRFIDFTTQLVRIEITVRAFSYTPRNVDVQAQRWCLYEGVQFGRSGQGLLTLIG